MTELHLYFAQCLKTLSGEFSAGLTDLQTQFEKLLSGWEAPAGETQRSMRSLEQRVASLERKSQQDLPEDPKP